jgi:phosphoadenosine phosphosulfate reductase
VSGFQALDRDQLRLAAERAGRDLEHAPAAEVVRWAVSATGGRLAVAASMQDAVLPHLVSQVLPGVHVLFLDTGFHFAQTLATRRQVERALPVTVVDVRPRQSVEEQAEEYGGALHDRDPGLCCFLRKVEPLSRALEPYAGWVSGLRREDAPTRASTPVVTWDDAHDRLKINPIARWTADDVEAYQARHRLPRNPLASQGFPSIGCQPCTRRVAPGDDPRSGRWAGLDKVECGIHA